jgi:hypothetical protein
MSTDQEKGTDKPLGDAGSGATGGDAKQGVRKPNAAEIEPENRRLEQHPHQTAEVPYGSGDRPEIAGTGGMEAQNPRDADAAKK